MGFGTEGLGVLNTELLWLMLTAGWWFVGERKETAEEGVRGVGIVEEEEYVTWLEKESVRPSRSNEPRVETELSLLGVVEP